MGIRAFRDQLRTDPPVVPDVVWLLYNSIARAAANSTGQPGILQPWEDELNRYIVANGKFQKFEVLYAPVSPPPVFWDYKCYKCLFWNGVRPVPSDLRWQPMASGCKAVDGDICPSGYCAIWLPPPDYKKLTWPKELFSGNW